MLYPSVDKLQEKIHSKYLLVTLASKRAREMQNNKDYKIEKYNSHKNVGKALEEIYADQLTVSYDNPTEQEAALFE